ACATGAVEEELPAPSWWRRFAGWTWRPIGRMWASADPLDAYGLAQLTGAGGDALVAIALADSVFFSVPVDEAKLQVALYRVMTVQLLEAAGPAALPTIHR